MDTLVMNFGDDLSKIREIPIYAYVKQCWKCHEPTRIHTYHLFIDYNYTLGDQPKLDKLMMEKYPLIQKVFSMTKNAADIQNVCEHCGEKQGNWFVSEDIRDMIWSGELETLVTDKLPNVLEPSDLVESIIP